MRWEHQYDLQDHRYEVVTTMGYDPKGDRRPMTLLRIWKGNELIDVFDTTEWDYQIIPDLSYFGEDRKRIRINPRPDMEYEKEDPSDAYKRWLENDRERDRDAIQDRRINDPYEAWS